MENVILNNTLEFPVVGIGTFMLSPADAENSVREGLCYLLTEQRIMPKFYI